MSRFLKLCTTMMVVLAVLLSIQSNAQTSEVWLTQGGGGARLSQQASVTFGANSGSSTTININEGTTYQSVDGYGFTLTEGSAKVIAAMGATEQNNLLNELYGSGGIGMGMVRIGIGATDMSEYSYSYRDGASFSLSGPDLTYLIPILKKIIAINPSIKILATPWSAPMWMKAPQPASFTGGTLDGIHYADYAQYWLDYMNAMKAQGINIWGITPQNEPLNGNNTPSMTLTKENQLGLINSYIGPKLRGAGYNCKIIAYDHNCDNTDYPIYVANNSSYVDGAAFHLYAGSISALTTFKNSTGKNVYFTEQYTGAGGSFSGDLVWHTQNVTIGSANNWSRTAFEWNLATDPNWGPHTQGGCTDCKGGVTISGNTVTRNQGYYIIAHFSKFVKSNAVRIGATSNHGNLITTAFKNTDGSKVVEVLNNSGSSITFRVVWNNASFTYTLTGSSVVTFKWNGTSTQPSGAPIGKIITLKGSNNMYVSGENGTAPMNCNRASAGTWEQFTVVDAGGGKIGLQSMGKFVSSENGAASGITCNRTSVGGSGSWEQFDWVSQPDGTISLRGNNAQYVSSNNGTSVMTCNRATAGAWEAFTYTVVGTARQAAPAAAEENTLNLQEMGVYPNPVKMSKMKVNIKPNAEVARIILTNADGRIVWEKEVSDASSELELDKNLKPGIYHVQIRQGADKTVKRIVVE